MKVWGIWCEYDYGQEHVVFYNKKDLRDWFNHQVFSIEGDDWAKRLDCHPERLPWDELNEQGLVGYKEMEIR